MDGPWPRRRRLEDAIRSRRTDRRPRRGDCRRLRRDAPAARGRFRAAGCAPGRYLDTGARLLSQHRRPSAAYIYNAAECQVLLLPAIQRREPSAWSLLTAATAVTAERSGTRTSEGCDDIGTSEGCDGIGAFRMKEGARARGMHRGILGPGEARGGLPLTAGIRPPPRRRSLQVCPGRPSRRERRLRRLPRLDVLHRGRRHFLRRVRRLCRRRLLGREHRPDVVQRLRRVQLLPESAVTRRRDSS